jgi:DNA-directed RNA polymerase subunit RPC12/RpoP
MTEKKRILKSVIMSSDIESPARWGLEHHDNIYRCWDCGSNLFYVRLVWGVIDETKMNDFPIYGFRRNYSLREIGLGLHCAECGSRNESYDRFFYPKDYQVCSADDEEFDYAEMEQIKFILGFVNRNKDVPKDMLYGEGKYIIDKIAEYEKENKLEDKDFIVKQKKVKKK